jgi:predicted transcriptional regulator
MSLTIELPTETAQAFAVIAKNRGKSAEEYARELLESEVFTSKRLEELRHDVQAGLDALQDGRFSDYDCAEELINAIRREGSARLSQSENGQSR